MVDGRPRRSLATAPIAFRRRSPVWSLAFVLAGQLACEGWHVFGPSWLAVLVGVYSLGAHTEGRRRTYACAGALVVVLIGGTLAIVAGDVDLIDVVPAIGLLTAAFVSATTCGGAAITSNRSPIAPSGPSASGTCWHASASPRSATASPASCTTSSPTRSA